MRSFITILLISLSLVAVSQSKTEFQQVRSVQQKITENEHDRFKDHLGSVSGTLLVVYKATLSSQDYFSCSFSPSCSEHAHEAITKQGLIVGLMNTLDRLTRCHGLSYKNYPVDPETRLLIDPLRDARFNEL